MFRKIDYNRNMKFTPRTNPLNKQKMIRRDRDICRLYNKVGLTMPEIATREGITKERVRQILQEEKRKRS